MHAVFLAYGKKEQVDLFMRDMAAQKYPMTFYKDDEKDDKGEVKKEIMYIDGQMRLLPFGIIEHVFPKESMDVVLTTLGFHKPVPYDADKEFSLPLGLKVKPMDYVRKYLQIEPIPEFKTELRLLWMMNHVAIIPIGVRYDEDIVDPWGPMIGWRHEGI